MSTDDLLKSLGFTALNLAWAWNHDLQRVFAMLDPNLWEATNHSPLEVLRRVHPARLEACNSDPGFQRLLDVANKSTCDYFERRTWFERKFGKKHKKLRIAYFCSEFAIHESMQQYSGGLGVLAGDHVKSSSDLGVPLVGVGLLYRHGYYVQELRADGTTRVLYPEYDFADMPVMDTGMEIECPLGKKLVRVKIWGLAVGRVPLYLLDADLPGEPKAHRQLTEGLYKGEPDLRLRQQVLLGVGGMLALKAVKATPTVVHLNEGHAAFANVERLRALRAKGRKLEKALAAVRESSVFTTHTPVPAGHDRYAPKDVARHMSSHLSALGMTTQEFANLARERPGDKHEPFCMTVLGLRTSARVNGVAKLHGEVSRKMWAGAYGVETAAVPIGAITNGVHVRTWLAPEAEALYVKHLGKKWDRFGPDDDVWAKLTSVTYEELWALRNTLRAKLVHFVRERLARQARRRGEDAASVADCYSMFDEDALTLGFARRFATYKRAPLIFKEAERLAQLMGDPERPVQLVFAGKAHPRDTGGQDMARAVHEQAHAAGFHGRVALIEEYDMHVGRIVTSGADVWLNNPIRPNEASGTSGMKPPLHGGLNASILDGWWPEGFDGENGWAIGDGTELPDQAAQDALDAGALVTLLERELVPLFYERNDAGLPTKWLAKARRSLVTIPGTFNTHRMVGEYVRKAYLGRAAPTNNDGDTQ
jgi:starch phosphorylase